MLFAVFDRVRLAHCLNQVYMLVHHSLRLLFVFVAVEEQTHKFLIVFIFFVALEGFLHACLTHLFASTPLLFQLLRVGHIQEHWLVL